ncbi:dispersed gene family protein 1 (DGF-1), partial [Trypanosoma theileri]
MNGNVKLVNGALVLDGVLLEVMGKNDGYAMQVSTSSIFSLQEHSVFSLTNSSIISDAKGIFFGNSFTLTDSILRLARVDGRVSSGPLLNFGSGSVISTHGWLDLHNVMSTGDSTASIASLSQVKLAGGVLSIARSAAVGATLLTGPHVQSGKISVQCNRANGKLLQSPEEYRSAGLSAVEVVPCDSCARELSCFAGLTSSMPNCACRCSPGGVGPSCLPMDVPLAKADKKEKECMRGVAVTKSMTIGQGQSNVCFEAVAFSGPIIVTVDLRSMNTLAKTLDVTLQRCMLAGGAQLRIRGFDKDIAKMMPRVSLSVTNMTSTEGTIVLQGVLPEMSSVLLADSMLSSSVNESKYVITSSGNKSIKYSPVLVLDGVKFVSTNFVLTRTTMMCAGSSCAVILVEHGLTLEKKSGFYMDNCGVNAAGNVVNFISSDLNILDRSVFSLRNNSWRVKSEGTGNAWECNKIALKGGSVLEMTGNTMSLQKSVINMDLLKVEGNSWLLQRENEFQCEYVFKAEKVEFAEKNVWSVIRNKFWKPSLSRYGGADMWNQPISNNYQDLTVYGVCNYRFGEPVLDYTRLSMPKTVQKVECNTCSASAECFNGKAASSDNTNASNKGGCKCKCASGGHGDFCLPVAPPKSLGPLPPPEVGATDIPCVYGGNISSITSPVLGTSGMCFIGVHFTSPIVIDLSEFRPKRKTINITFVQCTMSSVSLTGVKDYAVHMNMRASTITDGKLVLGGKFGSESHIQLVDSIIDTTDAEGFVMESKTVLGSNSKILLLRTNIIAGKHAIYFNNDFALDANGFIVQNSRLEATVPQSTASAGLYVNTLQIKNSGYLSIVNTEIIAGSGVLLAYGGAISSSGRLVLVGNTLKGHGKITGTALLYRGSGVKLSGGSIIRVMLNRVKGTSIYQAKPEYSGTLELSGEGTAVIFSENVMEGDVPAFLTVKTSLTSQGKIVGGCNKKNGKVVSLKEQFENSTVTEFNCDACSEDVKCHMPGKNELTKSSSCSCSRNGKSGNNQQCPSCLPYEVPEIDVMNTLKKPVDSGTTCVENQILTELSLNMQKTHHCYIGVTFSGEKAVAKFVFGRMPLQKPINITFTGCTFLGGAALHFVGSRDPVNSAGVWIRVRKTVLLSSVVSFSNALPKGSDIAVREVDSVQTSWVKTPDGISNALSIVAMKDLLLSGSSILLVSDIYARHKGTSKYILNSGDGILAGDSLTLLDESSLYVQNCRFSRFEHMIKLNGQVNIDERSVMAFLENKLLSGKYLMFSKEVMINDRSVFRMVENSNLDGKGVYMYKNWDLHNSSWVDWRGNDVSIGELVHVVSKAGVNIDSNSMLTFIGKRKESKGASAPLLKSKQEGYKFISGCLTLPKDTEGSNSNNVTDQVECDRCVDQGHCFAPFTSSSNDCSCKCTDGGHGDVCVPGRVAVPLLPPPLPSPPAPGECMSNVKYPEVSQTLGNGLSSLCYRNVTFSGAFTRITVDLRAMTGDVVNITFDGCKWLSGAALVLRGGSENEKGRETSARSINIAITGNTFHEGMLSPFGSFPPRTNIIVSGSHFNVTRIIAVPDMMSVQRSCIMTKGLKLNDHSSLKLIDNSFIVSNKESTVMFVGTSGMTVKSHSMFAMVGNKFTFTDDGSAVLRVMGDEVKKGLEVQDNSVFAIEKSLVSGILEDFVFLSVLHAKEKSAFLVENNDGLMVTNILKIKEDMNLNDSWLRMHKNAAYNLSATVFRVDSTVEMAGSKVVLSGNSVSPVMSKTTPAIVALKSYRNHKFERDSSLIFACNVLNRKVVTEYNDKPTNASVNIVGCDGSCSLEGSCFPALSASISASNCACECTNGGHGDRCLPVHVPKLPDEDPCVRNINVSWEVHAGFRKSSVCYVGVTFTQDVVLDLTTMSGTVRNVTLKNCKMVGNASLYIVGWESELPAGQRVEVLISGLESRSGGGVLLAKNYPQGSHITVVDSVLVAETPVNYSGSYDLLKASACLVLYKLGLTGSVLTIARTQVITTLNDVRGVLVTGGVTLSSGSALYMQQLWVQAALGECVSVVGSVTARSNSVLAFVDSDFLSCSHAVSMQDPLTVAGSVVKFVRNDFVLPSDHAVKFHSPLSFTEGSMLLMKANTHDNSEKEMVMVAGTVTAGESILSFVRNQVLSPRMLSAKIETNAGAHLKVSCNTVGGNKLTKATEYAAAGFGNAAQINVFGCETCDKDTYCYPSGAVSSAEENGDCVCKCRRDSYGEVCLPVESITLPPVSKPLKSSAFALENTTVQSPLVVTRDVKEVTLRNLVMEGVQTVLYVPWMAKDNIRIFLQNISLRNGAVL